MLYLQESNGFAELWLPASRTGDSAQAHCAWKTSESTRLPVLSGHLANEGPQAPPTTLARDRGAQPTRKTGFPRAERVNNWGLAITPQLAAQCWVPKPGGWDLLSAPGSHSPSRRRMSFLHLGKIPFDTTCPTPGPRPGKSDRDQGQCPDDQIESSKGDCGPSGDTWQEPGPVWE